MYPVFYNLTNLYDVRFGATIELGGPGCIENSQPATTKFPSLVIGRLISRFGLVSGKGYKTAATQ